mmetsp:Transcript_11825/g.27711  ORF Transcript_11825/g.27711 Transcript_11825/m.27711 type:complete len:338 (+) Transcript_11825:313-1326(+)
MSAALGCRVGCSPLLSQNSNVTSTSPARAPHSAPASTTSSSKATLPLCRASPERRRPLFRRRSMPSALAMRSSTPSDTVPSTTPSGFCSPAFRAATLVPASGAGLGSCVALSTTRSTSRPPCTGPEPPAIPCTGLHGSAVRRESVTSSSQRKRLPPGCPLAWLVGAAMVWGSAPRPKSNVCTWSAPVSEPFSRRDRRPRRGLRTRKPRFGLLGGSVATAAAAAFGLWTAAWADSSRPFGRARKKTEGESPTRAVWKLRRRWSKGGARRRARRFLNVSVARTRPTPGGSGPAGEPVGEPVGSEPVGEVGRTSEPPSSPGKARPGAPEAPGQRPSEKRA